VIGASVLSIVGIKCGRNCRGFVANTLGKRAIGKDIFSLSFRFDTRSFHTSVNCLLSCSIFRSLLESSWKRF